LRYVNYAVLSGGVKRQANQPCGYYQRDFVDRLR
jgi:hypothetical protein